jgi:putative flippase GtrA
MVIRYEFFRFIIIGIANTVTGWLIFSIVLRLMPYLMAYTIAYVFGIFLSYFLSIRFVFKSKASFATFVKYPLMYLFQYVFGIIIMYYFSSRCNYSPELSMILTTFISIPATFAIARYFLKNKS